MRTDWLAVIGAGGQGLVVLDALIARGACSDVDVYDQDPARLGTRILGLEVKALRIEELSDREVHIAIGDNSARARVSAAAVAAGAKLRSVVHPAAIVSSGAAVGPGAFLAAGCVVGPSAVLGIAVIVNHNAVIDHGCRVGDSCHIAPGATLAGNVVLGDRVFVGAGANVLPGITVGDGATIGAGALVRQPVAENTVVVGVPARKIG